MILTLGALLIGGIVGVLTALFGVGGGFLITPLLNIVLGIPMPMAVGTSAIQILGVSSSSLYDKRHQERPAVKMAVVMFGGNYIGVQLGVRLLGYLSTLGSLTLRGEPLPIVDLVLLLIFIPLLCGIAWWLYRDAQRNPEPPLVRIGWFARIKLPPFTNFAALEQPALSIAVMSYFGLLMGLLTGLLGIGGGVLLLPTLVYLVGLRTRRAASTSLVIVLLTSAVAVVTHSMAGNIDYRLAIPLLVGGTLGARLGATIDVGLSGAQVRRYFVYVLLAAVAVILAKLFLLVI